MPSVRRALPAVRELARAYRGIDTQGNGPRAESALLSEGSKRGKTADHHPKHLDRFFHLPVDVQARYSALLEDWFIAEHPDSVAAVKRRIEEGLRSLVDALWRS